MRPTLRCVLVFVAGIPAALLAVLIHPRLWTVWLAYLGAAIVITGLDALLGLGKRRLTITAKAPEQLFIGDAGVLRVTLTARGWRRDAELEVLPELEDDLEPQPLRPVRLVPGDKQATASHEIELRPRRRGDPAVRALHLRWRGPLGLIERRMVHLIGKKVPVVPNVGAVRAAALRMFSNRELMAGMKVERYLGDGTEFESLREYVPGLDHRAIDWKSSARHIKLLTQEFRAERNHQVVIAVDTGQLMSEPLAGIPRLDHAINAGLLLSWFCLRTGDRVGLMGFDAKVRTYADPAGGVHSFPRLQRLTADLDYQRVETNYTLALADLSTRLKRRSLIILLTDFLDTVTAELMIENVARLARRHLVLFVSLRDPGVERRAQAEPRSLEVLHEAVVAGDFGRERNVVLERLKRHGVHYIDTTPEKFSMTLVNRYLDIKRRELI
jgi:uncharacterized protein (DUF58 family)